MIGCERRKACDNVGDSMANLDPGVVSSFGEEWSKFDHIARADAEELKIFELYFGDFPWEQIRRDAVAFDLGCGSGRWAYFVAPRVGVLHCLDASAEALAVARRKLAAHPNCRFHCTAVDEIPLADDSADLGYSVGVRNDAFASSGPTLERRLTKSQVSSMMVAAGLEAISFRDFPSWCAVGYKKQ